MRRNMTKIRDYELNSEYYENEERTVEKIKSKRISRGESINYDSKKKKKK